MEYKITNRRIGQVEIIELTGNLMHPFAAQNKRQIQLIVEAKKAKSLLFVIHKDSQINEEGLSVLLSGAAKANKSCIVVQDENVKSFIEARNSRSKIPLMDDEKNATFFFGRELVELFSGEMGKKRQYPRLDTALPLVLRYYDGQDEIRFFAVVTNLSEGGLLAQIIESDSEKKLKGSFDPYDLKMLHLTIYIAPDEPIEARGKIIHGSLLDRRLGIEFYDLAPPYMNHLKRWVEGHHNNNGY